MLNIPNYYIKFTFVILFCAVAHANIQHQGGLFQLKPDPYIELSIDGQLRARKTEVVPKTCIPTWNEHFTV